MKYEFRWATRHGGEIVALSDQSIEADSFPAAAQIFVDLHGKLSGDDDLVHEIIWVGAA